MATSTNEDSPVTLTPPLVSDTSPSPIDDEEQSRTWQSKYEALAKLYTQLRNEHLSLLGQLKPLRLASGEMSITAITSKVASYEKKITSLEAWAAGLEQQLKEYSVSRSEHVENNLAPAVAARELDALKRRNQDLESKVKVQEAEFGRQQNSIRALEQRLDESKMALKQVTGGRMGQASSSGGPINSGSISAARDIIFRASSNPSCLIDDSLTCSYQNIALQTLFSWHGLSRNRAVPRRSFSTRSTKTALLLAIFSHARTIEP